MWEYLAIPAAGILYRLCYKGVFGVNRYGLFRLECKKYCVLVRKDSTHAIICRNNPIYHKTILYHKIYLDGEVVLGSIRPIEIHDCRE